MQQTDVCRPQGDEALLLILSPLYTPSGHLENLYLGVQYVFEKHICHYRLFFSCGAFQVLSVSPKTFPKLQPNFLCCVLKPKIPFRKSQKLAMSNDIVIEAWNTVLFEKFTRFRHLFVEGYSRHSDEYLERNPYPIGGARYWTSDAVGGIPQSVLPKPWGLAARPSEWIVLKTMSAFVMPMLQKQAWIMSNFLSLM